ncbi:hypothetical protein [Xanthocytophaga flava]|uniref:hypothetical protein n=1 Tax=Xanthocytophaga flava TaxID=3048013 RepID=UPI0028D3775A|nr:hypothetical protein [Xanthocytophaga flavus]MDJ1467160.1 hypothetical protein [Xanthocytophaga flavus]
MKGITIRMLVCVTMTYVSCNSLQHSDNQVEEKISSTNGFETDAILLGSWHITSEERDGIISKCNICPLIEFARNGTGRIIKPSKQQIRFTFNLLLNNKIKLSFEYDYDYFNETEFFCKLYNEGSIEVLELNSIDSRKIYILSRQR